MCDDIHMLVQSTGASGIAFDTYSNDRNYSTHVLKRADEFLPPLNQPLECLFSQLPQQESDYTETPHHYKALSVTNYKRAITQFFNSEESYPVPAFTYVLTV